MIFRGAIGFLTLLPSLAFSCTCGDAAEISEDVIVEAYCSVDAVFVGRVIETLELKESLSEHEIIPTRYFKGGLNNPAFVISEGSCDNSFRSESEYLIFAVQYENTANLTSSICGPTRHTSPLGAANSTVRILINYENDFETLCGDKESVERRLRILRERRSNDRVDFEQLINES